MTPQIVFMALGFLVRRYFNFIRRNDLRMSPARSIHEPSSIKDDVSELSFLDEENGPRVTTACLESLSWSVCLGVKKNFYIRARAIHVGRVARAVSPCFCQDACSLAPTHKKLETCELGTLDLKRGYSTLFRSSLHLQAYSGSFQQRHWRLAKLSSILFSSVTSRRNRFPQRSLFMPNWTGYVSPSSTLLH